MLCAARSSKRQCACARRTSSAKAPPPHTSVTRPPPSCASRSSHSRQQRVGAEAAAELDDPHRAAPCSKQRRHGDAGRAHLGPALATAGRLRRRRPRRRRGRRSQQRASPARAPARARRKAPQPALTTTASRRSACAATTRAQLRAPARRICAARQARANASQSSALPSRASRPIMRASRWPRGGHVLGARCRRSGAGRAPGSSSPVRRYTSAVVAKNSFITFERTAAPGDALRQRAQRRAHHALVDQLAAGQALRVAAAGGQDAAVAERDQVGGRAADVDQQASRGRSRTSAAWRAVASQLADAMCCPVRAGTSARVAPAGVAGEEVQRASGSQRVRQQRRDARARRLRGARTGRPSRRSSSRRAAAAAAAGQRWRAALQRARRAGRGPATAGRATAPRRARGRRRSRQALTCAPPMSQPTTARSGIIHHHVADSGDRPDARAGGARRARRPPVVPADRLQAVRRQRPARDGARRCAATAHRASCTWPTSTR